MTEDTRPKIEAFVAAATAWAIDKEGTAEQRLQQIATHLEALVEAHRPGEYVGISEEGDSLTINPLLLAQLLRVAGGEPVRIGRACFNGAPPCDHAAANGYPLARNCPDCGEQVRERGVTSETFDRLVNEPAMLPNLERHVTGEGCEQGCGALEACDRCGFPVCKRCSPSLCMCPEAR